ncbi:hypothetical protein EGT74_17030 [Chitinophaga lutea]|uniref:Signal transduction histidine kinase internal region domain-containing protein n=1 Tax=Chitinophaga lutea TaxID=2488634 RepID=A0A3N4PMD1_9BACT|nr:histidine kinase [Chitinophaga lutea]RPE08738.1 hypothetical protein EGT74_17030 [Chitinophaga lutea]
MQKRFDMRRTLTEFFVLLVIWMVLMYGMSLLTTTAKLTPAVLRSMHIHQGVFGFLNFLLFYTATRWPLPQFLQHRRWPVLIGGLLLLMAAGICVKYFIAGTFFAEDILLQGKRNVVRIYSTFPRYAERTAWTNAFVLIAAAAYVLFFSWLQEDKRRQQLLQQKQEADFAFLKMQLNTHFLMNSLNSIYSLALVRSAEVVNATRTLTDILEYMVAQPAVTSYRSKLADEIRYLEDFIAMQRLRTGCADCVQLVVSGEVGDHEIAPLLLVPFVENAFKHGIANQPAKPVRITLHCGPELLEFSVHNAKAVQRKDKTGGIGLHNVRKRLDLIYEGGYALAVQETEQDYYCNLQIRW